MRNEKQKPLFEAGFKFTVRDGGPVTEYTVRKVRCVTDYSSGAFICFQYEMEYVITSYGGGKAGPFRFVESGEGVLALMEPPARQWYSFGEDE